MATNIAEVILRIRDESSKTIAGLTDTAEGYDKAMREVAGAVAKEEAAERSRAAALGLTVQQMREVDAALTKQIVSEKAATEAAKSAASAAATARNTSEVGFKISDDDIAALEDLAGATGEAGAANWQAAQGAQSFKKNLGDMFNQAIAGTDPMQILIQQGGALAESLTSGGSATDVLKAAFGGLTPYLAALGPAIAILGGAVYAITGVMDDYTAATERAKHSQEMLKAAVQPLADALKAAKEEQTLLNRALESGTAKKYLDVAELSISVDKREAEATAALREEQEALKTSLVDNRFEASKDGIMAVIRLKQIDQQLVAIHGQANELAQLEMKNKTVRDSINGMKDATDIKRNTDADKERVAWLKEMKDGIEAFQAAQEDLIKLSMVGNDVAIENARHAQMMAHIDEQLRATNMIAEAKAAVNAEEEKHLRLLVQAMAPTGANAADVAASQAYDQGLGGPVAPTTQGATTDTTAGDVAGGVGMAAGAIKSPEAMITTIGSAFGMWGGAIAAGVNLLADAGNGALESLSTGLVATVEGIGKSGAAIADFVGSIFGAIIPAVLDAIPNMLTGLMDGLPGILKAIAGLLPELVVGLFKIFYLMAPMLLIQAVKVLADPQVWLDIGKAFFDALMSVFDPLFGKGKGEKTPGAFMKGGWADSLFGGVGGKGYQTKNIAGEGGFFDRLFGGVNDEKDVPQYAVGSDYIARTGLAVVHAGETVVPAHGATNSATMDRLGGGRGSTYVINGVIAADTEQLVRHLREAERMGVSIG